MIAASRKVQNIHSSRYLIGPLTKQIKALNHMLKLCPKCLFGARTPVDFCISKKILIGDRYYTNSDYVQKDWFDFFSD